MSEKSMICVCLVIGLVGVALPTTRRAFGSTFFRMTKPKMVCKYYPKCTKSECSFAHQYPTRKKSAQPSSPKNMNEKACRHFLRGKCTFGTGCLYSHEADINDLDTGAKSISPQSNQPEMQNAQNPGPTSPVTSEDKEHAVLAEDKEPCSLYLVGQCTVDNCELDHPGETQPVVLLSASLRSSSNFKPEKSPTSPTYRGSSSLDARDSSNWADNVEFEERETEVRQLSPNDDQPQTRSASKLAVTLQPPSFSSPTILQVPLTTRAPTVQVTQPTQFSQQIVTPESQEYPHISAVILHWSQFADPLARAELAFCKLHAQDKCLRAESCNFRHSLTIREYFSLFRDPQPTLVTLRREGDPITTEATTTTIQPVIPPTAIHPTSLSVPTIIAPELKYFSKECTFFRSGRCRNGDHCPYAHVQPQALPTAEITPVESNEDDHWSPTFTQANINKPCKFFSSSYGYCRDGPDCLYLHQVDASKSLVAANNESDRNSRDDDKEDDNGWGGDWGKNDPLANTNDGHNQDEQENDQGINEWTKPQDISSWEGTLPEETLENRSGQFGRPCYRFKEGTCRRGASCGFAHDEPYSRSTRNRHVTNDDWSSFRTGARPAMTPDLEPWKKRNVEEEPEDPGKNSFSETSDINNGGNDGNGYDTSAPTQEPTNLPRAKSKEYCSGCDEGHCHKGGDSDTCQFRQADPFFAPKALPASDLGALENKRFSTIDTFPASTDIPHEHDELPLLPNIPDHPKVEKLIMNTTVSFGPTFVPFSIEPLAESRELRLLNLPADVTIDDVQALVKPYGGFVIENTFRNSQCSTSIRVDFVNAERARNAFDHLYLQEYPPGGRRLIASFSNAKLRRPADKTTLRVSWPKPTLVGWCHYPTVGKAKDAAARLNGVIIKGRKIQVEFFSPDKRQKDNFAIKFSNLSPGTPKAEIEELCIGHTLSTGFDAPTYLYTPLENIKEKFFSFGESTFERVPDSENDESPNSFAFVTFPCEAIAQGVMTELSSHKLSCIGDKSLEIKPVYSARYRVPRRIFDVVRQEIERLKEDGTTNYTIHCDGNLENYHIRLIASSMKYVEFVKANAELCVLLQGETARTEDGEVIWDDYFEMPSSVKALQHFLKAQSPNSIIPDEQTRRIRLFGSKAERQRAMEPLVKLLSKVQSQRHEVVVPRGSMHTLIQRFAAIQQDMGINKVTFDVLNAKIIVRGTKELSDIQNLVDSLNSPTPVYKPGCCEICHHQPNDPKIIACLHVYCTPCLRMALLSASHGPLRCIAVTNSLSNDPGQCLSHIPYIDGVLPPRDRDRLLLSSFLAHVRNSQDLFVCPSIDCKAVYRTGREGLNLQCSLCGTEICSFCQTLAHIGLSCEEMEGSSSHLLST